MRIPIENSQFRTSSFEVRPFERATSAVAAHPRLGGHRRLLLLGSPFSLSSASNKSFSYGSSVRSFNTQISGITFTASHTTDTETLAAVRAYAHTYTQTQAATGGALYLMLYLPAASDVAHTFLSDFFLLLFLLTLLVQFRRRHVVAYFSNMKLSADSR